MTHPHSIQAIVFDPSPFFIEGLEYCLNQSGHRVLAQFPYWAEATPSFVSFTPALAIVGPNYTEFEGLALGRDILAQWPGLKLILYSRHAHDLLFQADVANVGIHACLPSNADATQTFNAVSAVLAGRVWFSAEVLSPALRPEALTPREHDVLKLLAEDKADKAIAAALVLSVATVRNHSQHILEKLGVHHRHEAVRRARRLGWVF